MVKLKRNNLFFFFRLAMVYTHINICICKMSDKSFCHILKTEFGYYIDNQKHV